MSLTIADIEAELDRLAASTGSRDHKVATLDQMLDQMTARLFVNEATRA